MFSKILIANRGEIAVRIIRACKEMGIYTVAVYSEADSEALHASLADEAYCIGGPLVKDSYLNTSAIITTAKYSGAQAIHPGYGLLSENAEFAEMCAENGLVFIGPSADVIRKMGDKDEARRTMTAAGVPLTQGTGILKSAAEARIEAQKIGYPVLLKARSGGGGKGIRPVCTENEIEQSFISAHAEAEAAFGDGAIYMEKFLTNVKHVEVQILRDAFGKTIIIGDRDCSLQRKNQKLMEECPAPTLPDNVRTSMYEAAKKAAEAVNYVTVGTVEFLYDCKDEFWFMEMNTRLQVEHSVSEMSYGVDIVKWQIRTAAGLPISFEQSDIIADGNSIECRICAESPIDFRPSCGIIDILHIPGGPGVRFDSAIYQNYSIPPYYDSMLGKLIVTSKTREEALRKMRSALSELVIDGVVQNSDLFLELLSEEEIINGTYTTSFLNNRIKAK